MLTARATRKHCCARGGLREIDAHRLSLHLPAPCPAMFTAARGLCHPHRAPLGAAIIRSCARKRHGGLSCGAGVITRLSWLWPMRCFGFVVVALIGCGDNALPDGVPLANTRPRGDRASGRRPAVSCHSPRHRDRGGARAAGRGVQRSTSPPATAYEGRCAADIRYAGLRSALRASRAGDRLAGAAGSSSSATARRAELADAAMLSRSCSSRTPTAARRAKSRPTCSTRIWEGASSERRHDRAVRTAISYDQNGLIDVVAEIMRETQPDVIHPRSMSPSTRGRDPRRSSPVVAAVTMLPRGLLVPGLRPSSSRIAATTPPTSPTSRISTVAVRGGLVPLRHALRGVRDRLRTVRSNMHGDRSRARHLARPPGYAVGFRPVRRTRCAPPAARYLDLRNHPARAQLGDCTAACDGRSTVRPATALRRRLHRVTSTSELVVDLPAPQRTGAALLRPMTRATCGPASCPSSKPTWITRLSRCRAARRRPAGQSVVLLRRRQRRRSWDFAPAIRDDHARIDRHHRHGPRGPARRSHRRRPHRPACAVTPLGLLRAAGDGAGRAAIRIDAPDRRADRSRGLVIGGDVDGDGLPDACGRDSNGILCALAGDAFATTRFTPTFANGDAFESTAASLAIDANADGTADICGLAAEGVVCASRGVMAPLPLERGGSRPSCGRPISTTITRPIGARPARRSVVRRGEGRRGRSPATACRGPCAQRNWWRTCLPIRRSAPGIGGDGRRSVDRMKDWQDGQRLRAPAAKPGRFQAAITVFPTATALWLGDLDGDGRADACVGGGDADPVRCTAAPGDFCPGRRLDQAFSPDHQR